MALPNNLLNGLSDFTIAYEVSFDEFHTTIEQNVAEVNVIISGWNSDNNNSSDFKIEYKKQLNNSSVQVTVWLGEGGNKILNIDLSEDTWYSFIIKREDNNLSFYIDGKEIGSGLIVGTAPLDIIQGGLYIGQEQDELGGGFDPRQSLNGKIDNLYFYNRAINDDEVKAIFNGGLVDSDEDGFAYVDDCDDTNAAINPNATEIVYNGIDEDCNPATLDDDLDQDGFVQSDDCDDNNATINRGQTEIPYNGIDEDCNPMTLDDDLDQDGYLQSVDCNDNNAAINQGQTEIVYNGLDDDCNPATFDDDIDRDGFIQAEDCDDNNAAINPNAEEIPENEIDDDCNGIVDDIVDAIHEFGNTILNIFPNPATEFIKIEIAENLPFKVSLYDLQSKEIIAPTNTKRMELSGLNQGTYLLEITDLKTNQSIVERIVVVN